MSALPIAFGAPAMLFALVALPVIWWLLRFTPPRPQVEVFPPLRILASVLRHEETPQRSPWWLTLIRLLLAAFLITALAEPIVNPRPVAFSGGGPVALIVDNGWAAAEDWKTRVATAEKLIDDADKAGAVVLVAGTADRVNTDIGPFDARQALDRLHAMAPRPIHPDRATAFAHVAEALNKLPGARIVYLNDGLATASDKAAFEALKASRPAALYWYAPDTARLAGIASVDNQADALRVGLIRPVADALPANLTVGAFDDKGRRIAQAQVAFAAGNSTAEGEIRAPFELRNDISTLRVDGSAQAAATRLLDDNARRRRVALVSGSDVDQAQPLLSPLYYISRALQPFADLVTPRTADLSDSIPELLDQRPSVFVMADIGKLPPEAERRLSEWVDNGGTLIRFAGPRLAAAPDDDPLLPVRLRHGERDLGGTLSWSEPQKVAAFPSNGPFAGMTPPHDVTVTRQVLAEPSPDLFEKSWANLADGTPLVTGEAKGRGEIVLFHVTPGVGWSNLPISGTFVEMLRRLTVLSHAVAASGTGGASAAAVALPPHLVLGADGLLTSPGAEAKPLSVAPGRAPQVSFDNPPGFYGAQDSYVALNLVTANDRWLPLERPDIGVPVIVEQYGADNAIRLRGPLFAAALLLIGLDTLAVLWLAGSFRRKLRHAATVATLVIVFPIVGGFLSVPPAHAQENDSRPGDELIINAVSSTHLAYVVTGVNDTDSISKAGLTGLSEFLADRTALEPGPPVGLDIEKDALAFYPLIYWPVDASAPMPSQRAIARLDAYMQQGGTVLFDTRDEELSNVGFERSATANSERLKQILGDLNIPPLEPVPPDHVLTKSFYLMNDFPGRYDGSPLWVEASLDTERRADRPVRSGDGVTPIMITANDFAGAWAVDRNGAPLLPTVPADPTQRLHAFRAGVNIMMYMLTGNYKSDQVHIPALLERLGQ